MFKGARAGQLGCCLSLTAQGVAEDEIWQPTPASATWIAIETEAPADDPPNQARKESGDDSPQGQLDRESVFDPTAYLDANFSTGGPSHVGGGCDSISCDSLGCDVVAGPCGDDACFLFSGIYATYKKAQHGTFDLFWLWNNESQPSIDPAFGFDRQDGNRHTIGARYAGSIPVKEGKTVVRTWNWDLLGAWQFGEDDFTALTDQGVSAGSLSAIGGVILNDVPWTPEIKGVFWWGSGDDDPSDGDINTLNTLYPFGHYYWGLIDNINGANLLDFSVQASIKPADKLTLLAAMHRFDKASENDYIYNVAGAPLGNTTTLDRHIGNELDLLATYQVSANLQLQAGYFWFWYGDAVDNQAALRRDDAQQFYFMTTYGF